MGKNAYLLVYKDTAEWYYVRIVAHTITKYQFSARGRGPQSKHTLYMPHFKSIRCCSTTYSNARYIEMYQYHIYPIYFRSIAATISSITIVTIILKLKFSCKRLTLIPARSTDLLILGSAVLCPRHSNSYLGANNEQYDNWQAWLVCTVYSTTFTEFL